MARASEDKFDAVVDDAFFLHASADARLVQHVHRGLLQNARADAAQDVAAALALDDHIGDAGLVQQLTEQQPGGARADDGDLGSHGWCLLKCGLNFRAGKLQTVNKHINK